MIPAHLPIRLTVSMPARPQAKWTLDGCASSRRWGSRRAMHSERMRFRPLIRSRKRSGIMGFFAEFTAWLNRILATYVSDNTVRLASVLEPTIVTLAVLYI